MNESYITKEKNLDGSITRWLHIPVYKDLRWTIATLVVGAISGLFLGITVAKMI